MVLSGYCDKLIYQKYASANEGEYIEFQTFYKIARLYSKSINQFSCTEVFGATF